MYLTLNKLKANLYKIVDQVIKTGIPVVIMHRGEKIKLVPESKNKLENLQPHNDVVVGNPEDLVHMNWLELQG